MLTGQLLVGPTSTTVYGGVSGGLSVWKPLSRRQKSDSFWVSAIINNHNKNQQNHYSILGVSSSASSADIKKAYRLLARKWHPDVSKDSRAGEVFKNIHLAYQVLSNEATRIQYDRVLKADKYASDPIRRNTYHYSEFEDEIKLHRWDELRQKMRNDRYQSYYQRYSNGGENSSFHVESDEELEEEAEEERGSFFEVLLYAALSIFLMQTIGCQLALMFRSLLAWFDRKLDAGYKLGYLIALVLGGRGGVLLSLCLLFASWACGKNSSSIVALVVVAMWVGSNVMSYAPFPQGALLALLYMSIKLQIDIS
ncbi:Chaperone protein DnaJ [Bienertia sinuspersici]